jgi:hypothetical protein
VLALALVCPVLTVVACCVFRTVCDAADVPAANLDFAAAASVGAATTLLLLLLLSLSLSLSLLLSLLSLLPALA